MMWSKIRAGLSKQSRLWWKLVLPQLAVFLIIMIDMASYKAPEERLLKHNERAAVIVVFLAVVTIGVITEIDFEKTKIHFKIR